MEDNFNKLAKALSDLIKILQEFEKTKNDYKKTVIRSYIVNMLSYAKIIGNNTLKHAQKLADDIDNYLSDPQKDKLSFLIADAIKLQDDTWEL